MSDAYDMIDRFLRNNLGDDDYAEFSAALDSLCVATPQQAEADMRRVCEALGFDPTNHHNAAKCPYCRGQQPQAEPFGYVSQHTNGSWEFSPAPAGVYPDTAKSITAVYTKQPQAEAVPQTKQALADALYALQVPHVACQDGLVTRCMCRKCVIKRGDEALASPQQAEAVPKDHPLYVFATEVIHGAYRYTELPAKAKAAIAAQGEKP